MKKKKQTRKQKNLLKHKLEIQERVWRLVDNYVDKRNIQGLDINLTITLR